MSQRDSEQKSVSSFWPPCDRAASGRLFGLSCSITLCSFSNQVLVQLYLFNNVNINTLDYLKINAVFVGNNGYFHNEIDLPAAEVLEGMKVDNNRRVIAPAPRTYIGHDVITPVRPILRELRHWPSFLLVVVFFQKFVMSQCDGLQVRSLLLSKTA